MDEEQEGAVHCWVDGSVAQRASMPQRDQLEFWLTELEKQSEAIPCSIYAPGQALPHLQRFLPTDNIWHVSPH